MKPHLTAKRTAELRRLTEAESVRQMEPEKAVAHRIRSAEDDAKGKRIGAAILWVAIVIGGICLMIPFALSRSWLLLTPAIVGGVGIRIGLRKLRRM